MYLDHSNDIDLISLDNGSNTDLSFNEYNLIEIEGKKIIMFNKETLSFKNIYSAQINDKHMDTDKTMNLIDVSGIINPDSIKFVLSSI